MEAILSTKLETGIETANYTEKMPAISITKQALKPFYCFAHSFLLLRKLLLIESYSIL